MTRKLTVGVSLFVTPDANIWSSGVQQNVAFLIMCLCAMPHVGRVVLLNGGSSDQLPPALEFDGLQVPLLNPHDVTHEIDVVIEMGAKLPNSWIRRVKARGCKVISYLVGHPHVGMIEPIIFERDQAIGMVGMEPDEVWMLEGHAFSSEAAVRTVLRAPVVIMPHIWAPDFLLRQTNMLAKSGHVYGFDAEARAQAKDGWRAAIFEPNISVVKACFIPMLACESAYRDQPQAFKHMVVMNSMHMKEHQTFNRFATSLDVTRDHKASYEPRITVPECMSRYECDVVVSHQWQNQQNYLYYDVLHGGYPLVHNSRWLAARAPGFFYPDFEARQGGQQIINALQQSPEFWHDYKRDARAFLATLHPTHEANIQAFMARVQPNQPQVAQGVFA